MDAEPLSKLLECQPTLEQIKSSYAIYKLGKKGEFEKGQIVIVGNTYHKETWELGLVTKVDNRGIVHVETPVRKLRCSQRGGVFLLSTQKVDDYWWGILDYRTTVMQFWGWLEEQKALQEKNDKTRLVQLVEALCPHKDSEWIRAMLKQLAQRAIER